MLMTFKQKPSLNDCGKVAKALITFLKDDEGDREVSYITERIYKTIDICILLNFFSYNWFIYYRCNNVNRSAKEDCLPQSAKKGN